MNLSSDALEFSDTFNRHGGVEGYAQALEIGATDLPLDRWVQVRTPAFKAEYGDWEFARDHRTLRTAERKIDIREILNAIKNIQFLNHDSGIKAALSNRSIDKIISSKAFEKSLETTSSGFIHLAAAANVDYLFTNGILGWVKPDRVEAIQVKGLPRVFAPMTFDNSMYLAETTVKLLDERYGGNRIYTVEAINVFDSHQIIEKFIEDTKKAGNTYPITMAETDKSNPYPNSLRSLGVSRVINLAENIIAFNSKNLSQHLNSFTFEPTLDFLTRSVPSPLIDLSGLGNREAARKLHDSVSGDIAHLSLLMLSAQAAGKQIDAQALIQADTLHPIPRKDVWLSAVRSLPEQSNTRTRHQDKGINR